MPVYSDTLLPATPAREPVATDSSQAKPHTVPERPAPPANTKRPSREIIDVDGLPSPSGSPVLSLAPPLSLPDVSTIERRSLPPEEDGGLHSRSPSPWRSPTIPQLPPDVILTINPGRALPRDEDLTRVLPPVPTPPPEDGPSSSLNNAFSGSSTINVSAPASLFQEQIQAEKLAFVFLSRYAYAFS